MYTDQEKPRLNKFKILIFLNFVLDVEKANSLNISILIDFFLLFYSFIHRDTRPSPLIHCRMLNNRSAVDLSQTPDHRSEARLRIDPKVLVFVETTYSRLGRDIAELLVYNRIK